MGAQYIKPFKKFHRTDGKIVSIVEGCLGGDVFYEVALVGERVEGEPDRFFNLDAAYKRAEALMNGAPVTTDPLADVLWRAADAQEEQPQVRRALRPQWVAARVPQMPSASAMPAKSRGMKAPEIKALVAQTFNPRSKVSRYALRVSQAIFNPVDWKAPIVLTVTSLSDDEREWVKALIEHRHGCVAGETAIRIYSQGYCCK